MQAEGVDEDLRDLEKADEQGHEHRQRRDGQVVEDLPDRARERPRVRLGHERAVSRVHEGHARREDQRQGDDRGERKPLSRRTR